MAVRAVVLLSVGKHMSIHYGLTEQQAMSAARVEVISPRPSVPFLPAGLYRNRVKRVFDILLVLASLPVVLPVVLILAAINLATGAAPFYSQDRLGMGGRRFRIWKLRTMVPNADARLAELIASDPAVAAEWNETQKLRNDPRITRFGRLLRRLSLDELPQLWNVLKGDMSLVGPRPMLPEQRPLYDGEAYFRLRPGITGPWQVHFRNDDGFARRAICDAQYDAEVTLANDLRLILATAGVVARATGR